MQKRHEIIKNEEPEKVKYEFMKEYGNKIPIDMAIIESGFSPSHWFKIFKKGAIITKTQYNAALKKIAREKKANFKMMA